MTSNNLSNYIRYYHVEVSVNNSGILYQYDYQIGYVDRWGSGTINSGWLTYNKISFYITFDCYNNDSNNICYIRNFKVYDKNNIEIPYMHISDNAMWYANSSGNAYNYDNIAGY